MLLGAVHGATFQVTSDADSGNGTLRSAIDMANATAGVDRIEFDPGFNASILLNSPLPTLIEAATIIGPGPDRVIINGQDTHRILAINGNAGDGEYLIQGLTLTNARVGTTESGGALKVDSAGTVSLRNVEITANVAGNNGGGIAAFSTGDAKTLRIEDSIISGNLANDSAGVHVTDCEDSLVIRRSVISENLAVEDGSGNGGAVGGCANLSIRDSALVRNAAVLRGGGIALSLGGDPTMEIVNTTISENSGGGLSAAYVGGPLGTPELSLVHVTIADNAVSASGTAAAEHDFGIYRQSGFSELTITANNSIIAGNERVDCSPSTTVIDGGSHNLDSDGSCNLTAMGDLPSTDPLLDPIQGTGGQTLSQAPRSGSPVIDAADGSFCPPADQRGYPRPIDGDGNGSIACDLGAHEVSSVFFLDGFEGF